MTDPKYDKLDCMLFAAMEQGLPLDDIGLFNSLDESQIVFTHRFEKKKKKLVKCEKYRRGKRTTRKVLWRVAVAIMIIMSMLFIMMVSISAFRKAVVDVVVDFFENKVTFSSGENTIPGNNTIQATKKINLSCDDIEEKVILETDIIREVVYYEGGKRICSLAQSVFNNNDFYYDSDGSDIAVVELNGYEAVLIQTHKQTSHLSWSDGEYFYILSCYCMDYDVLELAYNVN